ncbi:MAG TPA: hypothetical protein VLE50_00365 [Cellvibrio sp.]|nr:hypothetical protein [Cellvibrio sp.]
MPQTTPPATDQFFIRAKNLPHYTDFRRASGGQIVYTAATFFTQQSKKRYA